MPSTQGQLSKEDEKKRKLIEMKSGDEDGDQDQPSEDSLKNKKGKTSCPLAPPQVIHLTTGEIYRLRTPQLGHFHFRAGDIPSFDVNGSPVTISDSLGKIIFSGGTLHDRIEVKEEVSGWTRSKTTTVTFVPGGNPRPQIQLTRSSMSVYQGSSSAKSDAPLDPPLQLVGNPKECIIINGQRSAVVTGSGGVLIFNGTGVVTVQGSLEGIRNNGCGTVKVKGSVNGEVRQNGSGTIQIDGDVHADIVNSRGGSVEVAGKHLNGGKVKNVPGLGRVSIGNGGGGWSWFGGVTNWKFGWGWGSKLI